MKRHILLLFTLLLHLGLLANDGAYFAAGNQLIPIQESDISVQKEILKVKKVNNKFIEVSVYYEFFNPSAAKEIIVGFEAISPSGDVDGAPKKGFHPYMRDFTVIMNDKKLNYEVAYVADSLYNKGGKIKSIDLKTFDGNTSGNEVDFFYVYHFKAMFKPGKNIVKHTYVFDVSGSIDYNYHFDYVLTAANRWANKQIDDFTLIVDMGDFEEFNIPKTFFKQKNDWTINGIGKMKDIKGNANSIKDKDAVEFFIQKGAIQFQKKNFKPEGELTIYGINYYINGLENNGTDFYLPVSIYLQDNINIDQPLSPVQRKIIRNLPYARRGYVFNDKDLKAFYEGLNWYIPNPKYVPDVNSLTKAEQSWLKKWKE